MGNWFPVAFASVAALMGLASFTNSRLVARLGMRQLSHTAIIVFTMVSGLWLMLASIQPLQFWLFLPRLAIIMSCFGWAVANMNSLSMEPLGDVAGIATSVFGFIQTVGGVIIASYIGQQFNGRVIPVAEGFFLMDLLSLIAVLVAEKEGYSASASASPPPTRFRSGVSLSLSRSCACSRQGASVRDRCTRASCGP